MLLAALTIAVAAPVEGALATEGEALVGATVERVEVHPEYERYWLRYAGGALIPAEMTRSTPGHVGLCGAQGLDVYPREELGEGTAADVTGPMATLCERLAQRSVRLVERRGPDVAEGTVRVDFGDATASVLGGPVDFIVAALGVVMVGMLGVALVAARKLPAGESAELAVVGATSVMARWLFEPAIFNGEGAAYEKIVLAWGVDQGSPYGGGFPALFGPALAVFGRTPEGVLALNRAWGALAAILLWILARQVGGRGVAFAAGLAFAVWPVHVRLSASEAMHVPVVSLLLLALATAAAVKMSGWRGVLAGVTAALSAGLATHTRPEAILGALPVVVLLVRARAGIPGVLLLVGLVVWRILSLDRSQGVLQASATAEWWHALLPRLSSVPGDPAFSLFWHAAWTPAFLWAFALLGLVAAPAGARWLLLAWWVTELPLLQKASPLADALRLQLATAPFWALLCGFGVDAVANRVRFGLLVRALPALGCTVWLLARPDYARWAEHDAFAFLQRTVPTLPADSVVLFDDGFSRAEKFQRVMQVMGPAHWMRASAWLDGRDTRGPTLVFRDVGCDSPAFDAVSARCRLALVETAAVTSATDRPVCVRPDVALYRVEECR